MDIGFLQKGKREGGYLLFSNIKRCVRTMKRIGNEFKWYYCMTDYEETDHYVSCDHYSMVFAYAN